MGTPTVADVFGAQISLAAQDRGLFLVIGRSGSPAGFVRSAQGQVVYQLPNDRALLAAMPVSSFVALRGHREIAHVGPVTIDGERFNQFLTRVAKNNMDVTGNNSSGDGT